MTDAREALPGWQAAYEHLVFEPRGYGVLLVTINRPEVGNAVNPLLHHELGEVWREIGRDPSVSVAVITGAGSTFCSGGEIGTFGGGDELPDSGSIDESMHEVTTLVYEMVNCRKPIISAVNGLAMASGSAIALSADISVVGENAKLNDGHLRGGMVAGDHAVLLWPLYMSLTKALSTANRIATSAQFAVQWTKRALNSWVRQQAPIFEQSAALEMLTLYGSDLRAAMDAITAGRKPVFPSVHD